MTETLAQAEELKRLIADQQARLLSGVTSDTRLVVALRAALADLANPVRLEWHKGTHSWGAHDGYRWHAHSINGVLTIDPSDPRVHISGGEPFDNPPEAAQRAVAGPPGMTALRTAVQAAACFVQARRRTAGKDGAAARRQGSSQAREDFCSGQVDAYDQVLSYLAGVLEEAGK